jgi:hypothetical protein
LLLASKTSVPKEGLHVNQESINTVAHRTSIVPLKNFTLLVTFKSIAMPG